MTLSGVGVCKATYPNSKILTDSVALKDPEHFRHEERVTGILQGAGERSLVLVLNQVVHNSVS